MSTATIPTGYRRAGELEMRRLAWGQIVDVLDTHTGHVAKTTVVTDAGCGSVVVKFRGGHLATLFTSNTDAQFVAVIPQIANEINDPNNALAVALRASNADAALGLRIRRLEESLARQADAIQGRPTMDQYEAVVADLERLRDEIRALRLMRAS